MSATRLPVQLISGSQVALCAATPRNESRPGISGPFHNVSKGQLLQRNRKVRTLGLVHHSRAVQQHIAGVKYPVPIFVQLQDP